MKRLLLILIVLIPINCKPTTEPDEDKGDRVFRVNEIVSGSIGDNLVNTPANLVATGNKIVIYISSKSFFANASSSMFTQIANYFDNNYSKITDIYGTPTDVDKNGKIILLFSPMPSGLGGYFTSLDLYKGYKNDAEIIYVNDMFFYGFDLVEVMDTIIHEFQHVINFNVTALTKGKLSQLWLNESLSESTYFVHQNGEPNASRFIYFTNTKYLPAHIIANGGYFYTWGGIESYITGSMFMYWLYQHGGGNDMIKAITHSANNYDYNSVVSAVNSKISGLGSANWGKILETWFLANAISSTTGITGYNGKWEFKVYGAATGNVSLYPGDAVFAKTTTATTTGDIVKYQASADVVLVYNKSTTYGGNATSVNVTSSTLIPTYDKSLMNRNEINLPRALWMDMVQNEVR